MTKTATAEAAPRGAGRPRRVPRGRTTGTVESAQTVELRRATDTIDLLTEQLDRAAGSSPFGVQENAGVAQLERQILGDPGWRLFSALTAQEFSPDGLAQLRGVCRLMGLVNPLIKRGLDLRGVYVHGQGCEIAGRATGNDDGEQDVNAVINGFVEDPANQRAVFGQQAALEAERALGTDGEVYIACFTRPETGWVQARTFSADEIVDVIANPDDKSEPWYYRRQWQRQYYDAAGNLQFEPQEQLYPDIDYRPKSRPSTFAGMRVDWWAPVVQVAVNRPLNWQRGIPDAYAAINWARAYKEFLEQWSSLMRSLAKFAWRLTVDGKQKAQAKAALTAAGSSRTITGDPNDVGGTALTPMGATFEPIPKSGATIDAGSGRPIAMMVAAAMNVPVTQLLADPGETGSRSTAETLDRPTELGHMDRRELWTTTRRRICRYVVRESVRAPKGMLKGTVIRDRMTDREVVTLAGNTDDTIDVTWPPLSELDITQAVAAVVQANQTGTMPPELVLRQLLAALGVRDPESIINGLVDPETGEFKWPATAQTQGQQAANLARGGLDPAGAGPGPMGPDGQPLDPGAPPGPGGPVDANGSAPVPTDGLEGLMADADFGLGGSGATPDTGPPPPAGDKPAPGDFDASYFTFGATAGAPDEGAGDGDPDEEEPDPMAEEQPISEALSGLMADVDYGLRGGTGGGTPGDDQGDPEPAGDKPDPGEFDPDFYTF